MNKYLNYAWKGLSVVFLVTMVILPYRILFLKDLDMIIPLLVTMALSFQISPIKILKNEKNMVGDNHK